MSNPTSRASKSLKSRVMDLVTVTDDARPQAEESGAAVPRARSFSVLNLLGQAREAILTPLRPFPLAHVAGASPGFGAQFIGGPETVPLREPAVSPSTSPISVSALQHAHLLMSQMPAWMTMPETRRNQLGQVVLCWQGDQGRQFQVVVDSDGMLIYTARLGNRGRFDGAEPIGLTLSPIILHVVERLHESVALPN